VLLGECLPDTPQKFGFANTLQGHDGLVSTTSLPRDSLAARGNLSNTIMALSTWKQQGRG
ncbi:hypothetical protein D030_4558B, partial [Vibrio parahaemolyticus AQ3810]